MSLSLPLEDTFKVTKKEGVLVLSLFIFLAESMYVFFYGDMKILSISFFAMLSMVISAGIAYSETGKDTTGVRMAWVYGLASGAMIASACAFLLPNAILPEPKFGGFGVALGVLTGFALHTIGHQVTHTHAQFDDTILIITSHTIFAGVVIGVIYSVMPSLGPLLGLAIVSHKGPAGYSIAKRKLRNGEPISILLLPSVGVGITAMPVSLASFSLPPAVQAIMFGFATGLFIHVALDFLPSCEIGGDLHQEVSKLDADAHHLLDALRWHAVISTITGSLSIFLLWMLITPSL